MPARRSGKEDREGGEKICRTQHFLRRAQGRERRGLVRWLLQPAVTLESRALRSLPKEPKAAAWKGCCPPSLPNPQRAPHKPPAEAAALGAAVPRPFLRLLAASRLLSPPAASAQDPFFFPFTTKETRGSGGEHTAFPALLRSLPTQLLPPRLQSPSWACLGWIFVK